MEGLHLLSACAGQGELPEKHPHKTKGSLQEKLARTVCNPPKMGGLRQCVAPESTVPRLSLLGQLGWILN